MVMIIILMIMAHQEKLQMLLSHYLYPAVLRLSWSAHHHVTSLAIQPLDISWVILVFTVFSFLFMGISLNFINEKEIEHEFLNEVLSEAVNLVIGKTWATYKTRT